MALLSSPIIAIYGVIPIYVFNKISLPDFFSLLTGLSCITCMFWAINIYVLSVVADNNLKKYVLSYSFTFIASSAVIFFRINSYSRIASDWLAYPLLYTLAINSIILIISNSVLLAEKKRNADSEIQELKLNNLEAQKQVLMQQLQPHFLFNALSTLKSLITENPAEAENYLVKLSEFLRYSIQAHTLDVVTLEQELKFTSDYIQLQKVRFDTSLHVEINIDATVLSRKIPVYALQVLVENAIKHNTFTRKNPLQIVIQSADKLITVSNNKQLAKNGNPSTGIGLANLNRRYLMIAGGEIKIRNEENQFQVTLALLDT